MITWKTELEMNVSWTGRTVKLPSVHGSLPGDEEMKVIHGLRVPMASGLISGPPTETGSFLSSDFLHQQELRCNFPGTAS